MRSRIPIWFWTAMVMYLLQLSGKYGLLEFPEAYIA